MREMQAWKPSATRTCKTGLKTGFTSLLQEARLRGPMRRVAAFLDEVRSRPPGTSVFYPSGAR